MTLNKPSNSPFYETQPTTTVLAYLLTLGLYEYYWHYKHWKVIQNNSGDMSLSPFLRAFFFPFFVLSLLSVMRGSSEISGVNPGVSKAWFGVLYVVVCLVGWGLRGDIYLFVFVFSVIPLYLLQRKASEINLAFKEKDNFLNGVSTLSQTQNSRNMGLGDLARKQFEYKSHLLPHKYTLEAFAVVIVLVLCTSIALHDADRAIAKAKLSEVFTSVSVVKAELGDIYAFKGEWPDLDLNYLLDVGSSSLVSNLTSNKDGTFDYQMAEEAPYSDSDILSFQILKDGYTGPMHINRWHCISRKDSQNNEANLGDDFIPSICRG